MKTESANTKGDEIMNYEERQRDIDGVEDELERCRDCGRTSEEGACFYCKQG